MLVKFRPNLRPQFQLPRFQAQFHQLARSGHQQCNHFLHSLHRYQLLCLIMDMNSFWCVQIAVVAKMLLFKATRSVTKIVLLVRCCFESDISHTKKAAMGVEYLGVMKQSSVYTIASQVCLETGICTTFRAQPYNLLQDSPLPVLLLLFQPAVRL